MSSSATLSAEYGSAYYLGVVLIGIILLLLALVCMYEIGQLSAKSRQRSNNNSHLDGDDEMMSISVGLQARKRILTSTAFYCGFRIVSIIMEVSLVSSGVKELKHYSEFDISDSGGLDIDGGDMNPFEEPMLGFIIYIRCIPVFILLFTLLQVDSYCSQLCVVLSGKRPTLPVELIRLVVVIVGLVATLCLGNNVVQCWDWFLLVIGLYHLLLLCHSTILVLIPLYQSLPYAQLERLQLLPRILLFLSGYMSHLLVVGCTFIVLAVLMWMTHENSHLTWILSLPSLTLRRITLHLIESSGEHTHTTAPNEPSLHITSEVKVAAAKLFADSAYTHIMLAYGLCEVLPVALMVFSIAAKFELAVRLAWMNCFNSVTQQHSSGHGGGSARTVGGRIVGGATAAEKKRLLSNAASSGAGAKTNENLLLRSSMSPITLSGAIRDNAVRNNNVALNSNGNSNSSNNSSNGNSNGAHSAVPASYGSSGVTMTSGAAAKMATKAGTGVAASGSEASKPQHSYQATATDERHTGT